MALGALGQVHISVTDVEASVAFYRDVLGMTHLFTVPGQPMAFFQSGEVRLYLGVPVGTPVLAVPELIIERCIVVRSTTTPWINYHVVKDPGRPDRREYSLDTRDLFEVLPPENADSEALERWLAEDWSAPANAHGHRLDAV